MSDNGTPGIKICGLTGQNDIIYANRCRPDYIGFVFAKSRRQVTANQAMALRKMLSEGIKAVGVFVNEAPETIAAYVNRGIVDMAQLHGQESEEEIRALRKLTECKIIRAFSIKSADDVKKAGESSADYILLDNGKGGTGRRFDWTVVTDLKRPFFLAGGLNAENIPAALSLRPFALDVSSGAETDGHKDYEKMRACVMAVRGEAGAAPGGRYGQR